MPARSRGQAFVERSSSVYQWSAAQDDGIWREYLGLRRQQTELLAVATAANVMEAGYEPPSLAPSAALSALRRVVQYPNLI
ncbi:hypothetical protein H2136_20200 [Aeromonas hydrophila]|uniref:Uncharacterized protein n=1 Tax=Aeromonas hydrophila TaxID=644 RepID=A0A926FKC4_AERHY|nr:hypothetical protein [Aeromonas hydrophila]